MSQADQYQRSEEQSVENRAAQETIERPERVKRLKQKIENLFVGENLHDLREAMFESLEVPQCGDHHNEGMYMDTHLDFILDNLGAALEGDVSVEISDDVRKIICDVAKSQPEALERYAFLHDISKKDCLTIKIVSPENGVVSEQAVTWQEWKDRLPQDLRDNPNPSKLAIFLKESGIISVSYFQKGGGDSPSRMHGKIGSDEARRYGDVGVSPAVLTAIEYHEVAFQFTVASCKTYEKYFGGMSEEERGLAITASYLDTSSSLGKNGKPDLKNFKALADSKYNYELFVALSEHDELVALQSNDQFDKNKFKKILSNLYRSQERCAFTVSEMVGKIKKECLPGNYDLKIFGDKLDLLVVAGIINDEQKLKLVELVAAGRANSMGSEMGGKLGENMRLIKEALEESRVDEAKAPELKDLNHEQKAVLFLDAFSDVDSVEQLTALDQSGVLDELFPEFGRNKHLTQDSRFHGSETVGEHSFRALALMNEKIATADLFSDPNFERLLRLTAFLHDIGKNEDEDKSPEVVGKEGRGYRVVTKKKEENFDRVRFSGHQSEGEEIFKNRIKNIQEAAPADKRLSSEDVLMVSLWIRNHMRGINAMRDLLQFSPEDLAEQIVRDVYPVELLNARIPLADVVRATIMMQEVELFSVPDSEEKEKMAAGWNLVKSKVEELLPILEDKNRRELTIPLIKGDDLLALGIPPKQRPHLLRTLEYKQQIGEVIDRKNALLTLVSLATELGIKIEESRTDELAGKGAFREMRARKENLKVVENDRRDGYVLKRYETTPVKQFTKDTPIELIDQMVNSGNFPNLVNHLQKFKISIPALKNLLLERGFANLLQLEFFVKEYCDGDESVADVSHTHSPTIRAVEITRKMPNGDNGTIIVNNGYQSTRDHIGAGLIHIGEQRLEALKKFYKKAGESDDEMVERFFEEAVINVSGTAKLEMPSDYDPNKYSILLAAIGNSGDKQFAGIVIDKSDKSIQVITTLFQESPKRLRADVRSMLRRLKEKSGFTDEQLQVHIDEANKLLLSVGEQALNLDQLSNPQQAVVAVETKTERKLAKEPVPIPDVLKPLGRVLKEKLIGVAEIYPRLLAVKNNQRTLDNLIDGVLRKKLNLDENQIQLILAIFKE